jgi:hypothetical protein
MPDSSRNRTPSSQPVHQNPIFRSEFSLASLLRVARRTLHWVGTGVLALALVPAFRMAGLPLRFNWIFFLARFWIGLTAQAVCAAALLYLLVSPVRRNLQLLGEHYRAQPLRLIFLALFALVLVRELGPVYGLMLLVELIVLIEYFDRVRGDRARLGRAARSILIPGAYLFVGLILVFSYNDVIASVEFVGKYSQAYNHLDSLLLGGWTVSQIAHAVMSRLPLRAYDFMEFFYFGMFAQVGAVIIFTAMSSGIRRTFDCVGTMLTAYYVSMLVFLIWPGLSPFTICPDHLSRIPSGLSIYEVQKVVLAKPRLLWAHKATLIVSADYYIAFPCMHIALPLIVLWFMRTWRRIVPVLIVYDIILVFAILLLEQHYVVDLIGGALVAALAIAMVQGGRNRAQRVSQ